MKNNILKLLKEKGISIRQLSHGLNKPYSFTHNLANRDSLATTQLSTLLEVANYLDVEVKDLYS